MKIVAVILGRKGSKRVPGKNIKPLCGKPLFLYTLEAALASSCVTHIIITTDDQKIVNCVSELGDCFKKKVIILDRPNHLASDNASSDDAILHALNKVSEDFDYVIKLQPTSPLRESVDIDNSYNLLVSYSATSVVSVGKAPFPREWSVSVSSNADFQKFISQSSFKALSQNMVDNLYLNGAVSISSVKTFTKEKSFLIEGSIPYVMPFDRSIDIDTIDDFELAEAIMEYKINH